MSQSRDFREFLSETVNLNQTRLNLLSQRVSAIENHLRTDEVLGEYVTEAVPQGSFAHGTIIKPVGRKEFDADILVPMDEIVGWAPRDYVQGLHEAFGRNATYFGMRSRKKRCVTVNYAGDFHVDVVPFIRRNGSTFVANRSTDLFEAAAPDEFTQWLEDKNRITNGNLVKVVRLLKYLRDHKTRYTVPSITLTAALAHHVSPTTSWSHPDAYKDVAHTLRTLADALAGQMAGHPHVPPYIADPGTTRDLADRWQNDNYLTFRTRFTSYAGRIGEACDASSYSKALGIWRDLFGSTFGTVVETAGLTAAVSKSLTPSTERFLDRDFSIPERIDPSYRVKTVGYLVPRRGFRDGPLPKRGNRVGKSRSLRFKVEESNIPRPYEVYWKIRNYGEEAELAGSLRGDIHKDNGGKSWSERTSYLGQHYVEAMIVKDGVCVAKSRQDVIVI